MHSLLSATNGREMYRVINTHVEAIKIGRQIAEQAMDSHRKIEDSGELKCHNVYTLYSDKNPSMKRSLEEIDFCTG